ncbi:MAG: NAD(P)H-dependent oxidoreductase [Saprospiraceae bacterium]
MHIAIISSSTRVRRRSHRVALGLARFVELPGLHTAEVLDLAAYQFPMLEEVLHRHPNAPAGLLEFSEKIRQADAFIFVSPEYNGSYTAALKNAVDYLEEGVFQRKAVGVVSVTSGSLGGIRAALSMQQLVLGLYAFPIPQMLPVGHVTQRFDESGQLLDAAFEKNVQDFLHQFLWLAEAVTEKRVAAAGELSGKITPAPLG